MIELLKSKLKLGKKRIILLNPKRANTDIKEQIKWEYKHLKAADITLFWFPCETLCPISLYELGYLTYRSECTAPDEAIVIGCHPNYARREDIVIQTKLRMEDFPIHDSLEKVADNIISSVDRMQTWV